MMTVKITIGELAHQLSMLRKIKKGCTLYNNSKSMDQIK